MPADTWKTLLEAAQASRAVEVRLTPAQELKRPKRAAGRPREYRIAPFSDYAAYDPKRGGRPFCKKRGCKKYLRKSQRIGCCEEHERRAIEERRKALEEVT